MKTKQKQSNHLIRMVALLAMLLVGINVSWGQTSYGKAEINAAPTSTSGWHLITESGNVKAWYTETSNEGTYGGTQIDNKWFVKLASNGIIKIRVAKGAVSAGDILRVEVGHFYDNTDDATLGFKVNGSNGSVYKSNVTDRNIYSLDYTLKAEDINIDNDAPDYDYIQFDRGDTYGGCAYHSVEILRYTRYTVTWDGSNIPSGCDAWFTIDGDATQYKATKTGVPAGASVTFHGTDSGNDSKMINGWNNPGGDYWGWGPTKTVTVNSDISVKPDFQDCILLKLTTSPAEGGTATVTVNGNDANGKKFFQSVKPTFTANVNTASGYTFDGWYDGSTKISSNLSYNADFSGGAMVKNIVAKFNAPSTANTITKPGCGGVYIDQTKLNAGTATLSISGGAGTVTTGSSGGYISLKFDQAYDFTDLKKYTVGGSAVAANLNNVEFLKDNTGIANANFYQGCNDKDLTDGNKNSVLSSVDEIRFHFKANTTTKIDYIYLEVLHGRPAKPTLASPTTTEMKIFSDETLQLRITNTEGFWREYTNDTYQNETTVHGVGVDAEGKTDWKPSYDLTGLTPGDYYFGIKNGGNCAENNKYHESELVKVHVKVIEPIASIDVNGTKRYYDVYAPAGITSSESSKVGVVISLHGASNDYDNGRVDFNGIAETEKNVEGKKFVVVYPRGLMRQLRGTERGWESYTENNTEDVDFFKEIVKELKKTYTVDDNRIYLAGFSNGGMMAYKAAHQAGDFFKAFASVGGYPVNESHLFHAGSQPTPFIHIQGKADGIFPDATYPLNVVAHNMMFRNGADFTPAGDGNGVINPHLANVEEDCHNAGNGGAAYYMYKVENMGHTWTYDWNNDGKDDIAETMWKFFTKDGLTNNLDKTLKFRIYDTANFWNVVNTGKTGGIQVGYIGFDKPNGKTVLTYGGLTNTNIANNAEYNKDTNNKNLWHSLQFKGVVGGTPHYLKLNITTTGAATDYFIIKLVKTGETTPVVIRRYQANAENGDFFINFDALNGWNEYKLVVERSREDLDVHVNGVEFHSGSAVENKAFFPTDLNNVLKGMNPIYQPVYGQTYDGIAKEYIPIANIPANDKVTIADILKAGGNAVVTINSSSTTEDSKLFYNIAISNKEGEEKGHKSKNLYVLGTGYTWDSTNGIALSHFGPAGMPAYIAGSGDFPTKGVIAMKVQGTFNLKFLLYNKAGDTYGSANRKLKVYYTNDQLNGELKEWKDWDFYGTRNETNANGKNPLEIAVRMAQLGQDGTSTIFLTYEGSQTDDMVWLKGIIAHRPDLKVTIGRTDKLRYDGDSPKHDNDKLTCFGENKPYQWNFGTSSFSAINPENGDEAKKINEHDGRTYITGLGPNGEDLGDHLLVYSDGASLNNKASFDGRPSNGRHKGFEDDLTDMNEHIEFNHPTKYSGTHASGAEQNGFDKDRRSFTPILSNGLKVNVTGSGWFSIACSAPNGPVNMKVLSSTNGGTAYINLLREFRVEKSNDPKPETDWQTYRVYLKAHAERDGDDGFWDGAYLEHDAVYGTDVPKLDPEDTQMSLYVVFDAIDGVTYKDGETAADAQLNIHYLQWVNEMPADYVFQREEDPKLLNSLQSIVSNGTEEKPGLYWQAGNDNMWEDGVASIPTKTITPKEYSSSFNSGAQIQDAVIPGVDSGYGSASRLLGGEWNVAANANSVAHTEVAYKNGAKNYSSDNANVYSTSQANGTVSDQNLEFAIPISGSFFRFMPMKNQFISTWVVPEAGKSTSIYILDETGKPIPFCDGADTNGETNKSKITQEARERGWIHAATYPGGKYTANPMVADGTKALRIDFAALAGKEYFIVTNGGKISLARLQATDNAWRVAVEETTLDALTDNNNNYSAISSAMSGTGRYIKSVTLNRDFTKNNWYSLVLPFSMNEKKLEEVFGVGTKCLHFTDVDTDHNVTKLTHHYYNMIVAGRPVFICPGESVTNPEITDVTLQTSEIVSTTTDNGNFMFTGSYDNQTINNGDLFMSNTNEIMYLKVDKGYATYPGMRSFIKNVNNYNFENGKLPTDISNGAKTMFLNFDDMDPEFTTGIGEFITSEFGENAVVVTKSTKVYDLKGRVVANGADMTNLPAGIYIVNGKKFIVK